MNVAHLVARAGTVFADLPALGRGRRPLMSYGTLYGRARALAGGLGALGLAPGDRVALVMRNCPEYVEALWGIWIAGLAAVPINAKLHPKEIAYILDHAGAALLLATSDLLDAVEAAVRDAGPRPLIEIGSAAHRALFDAPAREPAATDRDDLAWLFYTSGTTGRPKGAMLTHGNLVAVSASYFFDIDAISPGESILHAAPLSHGSGLYALPHTAAGAAQIVPESGGFDPAEILDLLPAWNGVSMFAAPTMVKRLVAHVETAGADHGNLKTIVYGGAPMYVADVKHTLRVLGPKLAQLYGQGEAPMCITGLAKRYYADRDHPKWERRIASAGFAQTVVQARAVDAEDRPLPPGEAGEICARGASVMRGYWRDAPATAEALRGGWLHTGDVGAFDEDGFLTIMDRSKDLIISGGSNIYPREIEEALLKHPAVLEVSVVGEPDPEWGERVVAFVVARPGVRLGPEALDAHVLGEIARFKRPKRYVFLDALPKSNYGKILKRELRERLSQEAPA